MLLCWFALFPHQHTPIWRNDLQDFLISRLDTKNHHPEHQIWSIAAKALVPMLPRDNLVFGRYLVCKARRQNSARPIGKIGQEIWLPQWLAVDAATYFCPNT